MVTIGQAAEASGISVKMIRYYETIKLLPPATRTSAGYRVYSDNNIHTLSFIKQCRNLGFSLDKISDLLNLWKNQNRKSSAVKKLASAHVNELDKRIKELEDLRDSLSTLIKSCKGNNRPDCPILAKLASEAGSLQ